MHVLTRTLLPLMVILLIAGCGARRGAAGLAEGAATVEVRNQSWSDMRIYAVSGSQRTRLGTVTATSSAVLRIPSHVVAGGRDVSFLADALAGGAATSFNIFVRPGDQVGITIPSTVR